MLEEPINVPGVYAIVCYHSGKWYIGSSCNMERRFREHIKFLNQGKHINKHLQFAWNKHGGNSFFLLVIERVETNLLIIKEQFYLENIHNLYNIALKADCPPNHTGYKDSPETKIKKSIAQRGLKKPACHRISSRLTKLGKKQTPKHIANRMAGIAEYRHRMISLGLKATKGRPKPCAEETKRKLSEAAKAQWADPIRRNKKLLGMRMGSQI